MIAIRNRPTVWFSAAAVAAAIGALAAGTADESDPPASTATVVAEGLVTYKGRLPESVPVPEANDVRRILDVNPRNHGLKDVMVWLTGAPAPPAPSSLRNKKPATMDQRNYFFLPHVLAIDDGQEVEFLNSDAANHGVMATAFDAQNSFNVVTPPGGSYKHRFAAAKRPVKIGCPFHAGMAAWVYVFRHPYHAVTDADGRFRLPPLQPGKYTVIAEHPDTGMRWTRPIELNTASPPRLAVEFSEKDLTPNS